jgi:hypothetical protein
MNSFLERAGGWLVGRVEGHMYTLHRHHVEAWIKLPLALG